MQMESLYQEIILDHYKHPRGRAKLAEPSGSSYQVNPTCGDEVTLRVTVDAADDGALTLGSVTWEGQGCSISQASLSVMTELVEGGSVQQAEQLGDLFRDLMGTRGKGLDDDVAEAILRLYGELAR